MTTAICAIAKNESRYIAEWISYHLAVGFDHVFIYDHKSSDRTAQIVEQASRKAPVELISWRSTAASYQLDAYADAARRSSSRFDWILFVDIDEFFVPERDFDISSFVSSFPSSTTAIAVPWLIFGSSGRPQAPTDELVIASYMRRAHSLFSANRLIKTLARPESIVGVGNPHMVTTRGGYANVDGSPVEWLSDGVLQILVKPEIAHINHYFTKSKSEWVEKLSRGYEDGTSRRLDEFQYYDRNEVFDAAAMQYLDQTKANLNTIFAEACISHSASLKANPSYTYNIAQFNPESYLKLNPDVAAAQVDPLSHLINHGIDEKRRYIGPDEYNPHGDAG